MLKRTLRRLEAARVDGASAPVNGPRLTPGLAGARVVPDSEPGDPLVSVLVPAYNEAETVAEVVEAVAALPLWCWLLTVAALTFGGPGDDIVFGGAGVMEYAALLLIVLGSLPPALLLWRHVNA